MVALRAVRGMVDLFEEDLLTWRLVEKQCHEVFARFGFSEIRTPVLEELDLFVRGVGEGTDIVEKEMFTLTDNEKTYCLRPENTASVVRALLQKGAFGQEPESKWFYVGPMFRKERPQKGRLRQFHQFGVESFGISEPFADIEVMVMLTHILSGLGLSGFRTAVNSSGTLAEREAYVEKLRSFFAPRIDSMCEDCKRRLQKNPLRILDCKQEGCLEQKKGAPKTIDHLGPESALHFENVCQGLKDAKVDFFIEPYLVRGLDYYCHTVFEVVVDVGLGSQNALAGGGRYDGLVSLLGGKTAVPAVGFAAGIERIVMLLHEQSQAPNLLVGPRLSLIYADDKGYAWALRAIFELRKAGLFADMCGKKRSLKSQMRRADALKAEYAMVVGESEIQNHRAQLKGLNGQGQKELALDVALIFSFFAGM